MKFSFLLPILCIGILSSCSSDNDDTIRKINSSSSNGAQAIEQGKIQQNTAPEKSTTSGSIHSESFTGKMK